MKPRSTGSARFARSICALAFVFGPAAASAAPPDPWPPPLAEVKQTDAQREAEGRLHLKMGERALHDGAETAAVPLLRRAAALLPDLHHAHSTLGAALLREGRRLAEARAAFQRSLALFAKNPWAHSQLGYLCDLEGKSKEALLHHQKAVELDPNIPEYQERLGRSLLENGRRKEARLAFEEVVARDWRSTIAVSNLAELYEEQGAPHKAEKMLLRLLEFAPKQWPLWDRLARFYDRQKRPADAEKARAEIRKLTPAAPVVRNDFRALPVARKKSKKKADAEAAAVPVGTGTVLRPPSAGGAAAAGSPAIPASMLPGPGGAQLSSEPLSSEPASSQPLVSEPPASLPPRQ